MSEKRNHSQILAALKSRGMRITKVRKQLVEYILNQHEHWSVQDLAEAAQRDLPGVGIATIYRTVNLLVAEGSLTRTIVDRGLARFEVTPSEHHDHLSCVLCGKIVEFENAQIEKLQEKIAEELGFKLTDHRMELFGECKDCRKARRAAVKEK
jgi:Fur family transcriptional regulator, ferric uptake regulator